jgi:Mg2+-importing ATPase
VKRLVTIEDLGNIEVLFTDKTGTLTEGAITFDQALDPAGQPATEPLLLGLVCNEATITAQGPVGGNALDVALWLAPAAQLLAADATGGPGPYQRLGLAPFDHERQLASVAVRTTVGTTLLVVKGAPEAVLARCVDVSADGLNALQRLFADGARVVAVATRDAPGLTTPDPSDEHDLRLGGFLTFIDRPKADAGQSIAKLNSLGVAVKIITGDNGTVASRVCRDLGLDVEQIRTGAELERLDDDALAAAIGHTTVFARVSPDQKSRIIKVARRTGVDVAFLGDGVNDAVALHAADVGISVDSATDVAKDAADLVLLDKDLGVLADGVTEGRRVFANTLKYVLMATSSNFGNMFSAAGASLFLPFLPSQLLLNNLLYDTGQLAIPTDRVDPEVLARPAAWDIGFVRKFLSVFGPVSSIFDFLTFFVMLQLLHASHSEFRSGWFVESLATQTLVVFVIRTRRVPFFRSRPCMPMLVAPVTCALIGAVLPFTSLAGFLGFATLPVSFFLILLGMIATYLLLVELVKRRFTPSRPILAGRGQPSRNATSGTSDGVPPASPTTPPMTDPDVGQAWVPRNPPLAGNSQYMNWPRGRGFSGHDRSCPASPAASRGSRRWSTWPHTGAGACRCGCHRRCFLHRSMVAGTPRQRPARTGRPLGTGVVQPSYACGRSTARRQ